MVGSGRSHNTDLHQCLLDIDLFDLPFKGSLYTWSNRRDSEQIIARKLDRVLVNDSWLATFPNSEADFTGLDISDHTPGIVTIRHNINSKVAQAREDLTRLQLLHLQDPSNSALANAEKESLQVYSESIREGNRLIDTFIYLISPEEIDVYRYSLLDAILSLSSGPRHDENKARSGRQSLLNSTQAMPKDSHVFLGKTKAISDKQASKWGLVFALGLAVRIVLVTEDIPERGNWMLPVPAGAPNLELQIGPPGVRVEVGDDLSPIERRVKERLAFYEPGKEIPLDDVEALVRLKRDVVGRMAQLDPHPFWVEQRDRILSESILTPQGPEYQISTLTKKLEELGGDNGSNSHFFRKLKKMREDFLLFGRFD
ncbi:hypothetical protein ACOSQ2_028518 [Xanthoceras sorbifolium]